MNKAPENILLRAMLILTAVVMLTTSAWGQMSKVMDGDSQTEKMVSIGDAFVQASNMDKAIELYSDAIEAAKTPKEKWLAADRLSTIYSQIGKNKEAMDNFDELMSDPEIVNDSTLMMNIYGKIGQIYYNMKDYVKSMKSYEKVKTYMDGSSDKKMKAILSANMAKTLMVAGDIKEAERLLNIGEDACHRYELERELADIYNSKAILYEQNGEYRKAYENRSKQRDLENQIALVDKAEIINAKSPWAFYHKADLDVSNEKRYKEMEAVIETKDAKIEQLEYVLIGLASIGGLLILLTIVLYFIMHKRKKVIKKMSSSNEDKKHMMSIIAHDFISPFNAMIGFAELQMQYAQAQDDTEMQDYSRTIYNSAQTLFQMVGNILAWSQVDSEMKPKRKNLNVGGEVENVVAVYRLMAEEKGVHINVSIDDSIEVYADENHFNIVMRNIMSNALKYTPKGGRISISSLVHMGKTSIVVDDTGVGMSKENVERINKHMSVESTLGTQDEKGIGIGLAICGDLVKINKGTFEVRSVEGTGTTVTLEFNNKA